MVKLVDYAAQNPGLEYRNYYSDWRDTNGVAAFRSESRNIQSAWRRVCAAVQEASNVGVTDADLIAEAPHAYSGRLEWKTTSKNMADGPCPDCGVKVGYAHKPECKGGQHTIESYWDYCTGQYWPTEYRSAVAVLIEYAIRRVRQSRPPMKRMPATIAELCRLNKENGGCWFEEGSMRFFGTRIETEVIGGCYFVTSEQPPHGERGYTIRKFDDTGDIETVGELCGYGTKARAVAALREQLSAVKV